MLQRPADAVALVRCPQAIGAGEELQVLGHRQLPVERKLLGHVPDALPGRGPGAAQVHAGHAQRAACGREQPAEHAKRRGLARPVGPEQAEDLAPVDVEADVVDGGEAAKLPDQVADLDDTSVALSLSPRLPGGSRVARGAVTCLLTVVCFWAVLCRNSTMNPSSNRGGTGRDYVSERTVSRPLDSPCSAVRTNRTRPPSGTASTTPGCIEQARLEPAPAARQAARPGTSAGRQPGHVRRAPWASTLP